MVGTDAIDTRWHVTDGPGLAVLNGAEALLIDPRSLDGPDDIVDLLTAMQASDPEETLMLVAERLSRPTFVYLRFDGGHCAVWRVGEATLVGAAVPDDVPDGWSTDEELRATVAGAVASGWRPASATIEVAGGIAVAISDQGDWWTSGDASPEPRAASSPPNVSTVEGVRCARGHLNNPASLICMYDGLSLATSTQRLSAGPRPAFASLFTDDGDVISLEASVLLGREPASHDLVHGGHHLGVALPDPSATMSRAHAEIRLVGWEAHLVDVDSRHGTYHRRQAAQQWDRLTPYAPVRLGPGDEFRLGSRVLRFERHDGAG